VRRLYEAFARGDMPVVLGAMDSKIEWRQAEGNPYRPTGEPWIGPDAILNNLFKKLATEWDGFTVNPNRFHDAGETIVAEGRYTGSYKPTGKAMDTQFCHVWTLKGGKLTRFQQYLDTAKVQEVMGHSRGSVAAAP
jgi:ketosteroid isomerase-like protein